MNETLQTIHQLRTIHGDFSDLDISDQDLKTIVAASVRAANASNRQSYSTIVVEDRKKIAALTGYEASKALIICVDFNRLIDTANFLGHEFTVENINMFVTACIDASLVAQTATIAARSLGIDCLLTNGIHRGDMKRVYDILNLPEKYCFPLVALLMGFPMQQPNYKRGRLSSAGVIHYEGYQRLRPEEIETIVQSFDDPNLHLGGRYDRANYSRYLDWFFDVWSNRAPKSASKSQMQAILEESGFLEC